MNNVQNARYNSRVDSQFSRTVRREGRLHWAVNCTPSLMIELIFVHSYGATSQNKIIIIDPFRAIGRIRPLKTR